MWEVCIYFRNYEFVPYFKECIYKAVKECNGVVVELIRINCPSKILIAVPISSKAEVKELLKQIIAKTVLCKLKRNYIKKHLPFDLKLYKNMDVVLQTLMCLDSDIEQKYIIDKLDFENSFDLYSFFDFRLKNLKSKWDELTQLVNDNIMYLFSEDSFNEFIKFLISNLEHRYYAVNIFSKKDCYLLCDVEGRTIKDYLISNYVAYDDNNLLLALIALNPEKIIIHCNVFLKDKLLKNLYAIFPSRIEICK